MPVACGTVLLGRMHADNDDASCSLSRLGTSTSTPAATAKRGAAGARIVRHEKERRHLGRTFASDTVLAVKCQLTKLRVEGDSFADDGVHEVDEFVHRG